VAQQFDYVVSSLALHRESTVDAQLMIKRINLLAKRGILISDWLRDVRALLWVTMFSYFTRDQNVRYSAQVAIKKGFTMNEIRGLAKGAALNYATLQKNFGYRFSLAGERGLVTSPQFVPVTGLAT
jgi:hypothetical protein